jgi:hypothetical protein
MCRGSCRPFRRPGSRAWRATTADRSVSTYRLQLSREFDLLPAAALVRSIDVLTGQRAGIAARRDGRVAIHVALALAACPVALIWNRRQAGPPRLD